MEDRNQARWICFLNFIEKSNNIFLFCILNSLQKCLWALKFSTAQSVTLHRSLYVPVNSKTAHAPPPPGQTPGHLTFLKNFGQIPRYVASLDGQMPHPLELQRGSNPPSSRHVKLTVETSSSKFSTTTNFLLSLSSLHTLNKGLFHDRTIQNDNNRKTHVESTKAMTRERG